MTTITIQGMTCGHCVAAVKKALSRVAGVERVADVNLERGEARVEGKPERAALEAAVRDAGYVPVGVA